MAQRPRIAIIGTGGTISATVDPASGKTVSTLSGADLLRRVPALESVAEFEVHEPFRTLSANMQPEQMFEIARLANRLLAGFDLTGVVVLHGTSTMEESAYLADLLLAEDRPVVFTGAMYSAQAPDSDGPRNIFNAARVAASPEARAMGALVCFDGEVHAARDVGKVHKSRANAFSSFDHGTLGRADEDRVIFHRRPLRRRVFEVEAIEPRVDLIKVVAGSDDRFIRASVASGAVGMVIEGMPGRGNLPVKVAEGIRWACEQGSIVVLAGRAPEGRVLAKYGGGGGVMDVVEYGCLLAGDLLATKARVLLMVLLGQTRDRGEIRQVLADIAP